MYLELQLFSATKGERKPKETSNPPLTAVKFYKGELYKSEDVYSEDVYKGIESLHMTLGPVKGTIVEKQSSCFLLIENVEKAQKEGSIDKHN